MTSSQITPSAIAGIGVDGQSWSAIAVDQDGLVLTDTPIWMDVRSDAI
jgi:xylulokinase